MSFRFIAQRSPTYCLSARRPLASNALKSRAAPSGRWQSQRAYSPASWSTSSVILLTVFTATASYLIGSAIHVFDRRQSSTPSTHPLQYASQPEMEHAVAALQAILGHDAVSTDADDLHRHGFSEWASANADNLPIAIAYPRTTDDVSSIAKICSRYRVPMIPFSGGTSLEGNFCAPFGGICIDFAYMDRILEVHQEDMDVVVQPAVPWMHLNDRLTTTGLWFPVDPAPTAQIGGMIATSCSGTNAVRYGTMRDWVINLTVVLADGTVIKTKRRPRKSAAGYNLNHLFVGSEGTLGIVTEITLRLTPIPQETSIIMSTFPTMSSAASAASEIMQRGIQVGALELMDDVQMRIINMSKLTERTWAEFPTLMIKLSGAKEMCTITAEEVRQICEGASRRGEPDLAVRQLQQASSPLLTEQRRPTTKMEQAMQPASDIQPFQHQFSFATGDQEKQELWAARKNVLWSLLALRSEDGTGPQDVYLTDVAVPLSFLPTLIEETQRDLKALGVFATALGHVGDGNFHTAILYDKKDRNQRQKVDECVKRMVQRALQGDGTCAGEHGIGMGKKKRLMDELGPDAIALMRTLKRSLDPLWLLNPGKIFDI